MKGTVFINGKEYEIEDFSIVVKQESPLNGGYSILTVSPAELNTPHIQGFSISVDLGRPLGEIEDEEQGSEGKTPQGDGHDFEDLNDFWMTGKLGA